MIKTIFPYLGPLKCMRLVSGLLCVIGILFLVSCKSDYPAGSRQSGAGDGKAARQVKTARVEETPFGEAVTANGTLAAYDQTTVSVKVPGRLDRKSTRLN